MTSDERWWPFKINFQFNLIKLDKLRRSQTLFCVLRSNDRLIAISYTLFCILAQTGRKKNAETRVELKSLNNPTVHKNE